MHAWEQIQLTIDYIEDHLSEELKTEDLARIASLSQFYYQRLFSRLVKRPVNEYIKLRRLALASEALLDKNKRILDIALDHGFSSHETFTRNFKETFKITPEVYRANPVRLNNFVKPQLLLNYILVDENVPLIADDIVLEITRRQVSSPQFYIGLTQEFLINQLPGSGATGVDTLGKMWDTFHERKSVILEFKEGGDEIAVASPGVKEGHYSYFVGAEAMTNKPFEQYTTWELPSGEYIVCTFEAEDFEKLVMDALYKAHRYLFETWLPNHNLIVKPFAVERYTSHNPDTNTMEIWVLTESKGR